jgi:hypothetical protein
VTEEIVLTLPRQRRYYDVAHLVVGGLAARLDLTVDTLADLQTALDGLLPREQPDGEVTVVLRLNDGALAGRIGPFDAVLLQRELANDGDGYGTTLVLDTVFESYRVAEDAGGAWVDFTMAMQTKGEA